MGPAEIRDRLERGETIGTVDDDDGVSANWRVDPESGKVLMAAENYILGYPYAPLLVGFDRAVEWIATITRSPTLWERMEAFLGGVKPLGRASSEHRAAEMFADAMPAGTRRSGNRARKGADDLRASAVEVGCGPQAGKSTSLR